MNETKHVVVVGAGIIGLCCAYYLSQEGHRVTVIDRGDANLENCSYGNAGLVVPSHIVPLAAPGMMLMGLKWMRDPESPFYVKPRLSPDLVSWGWKFFRAGTKAHVERSAPLLRDLNMASRAAFEELDAHIGGFDFQKRGLLLLFKTAKGMEEEGHVVEMARRLGMSAEMLDAKGAAQLEPNVRMDIEGAAFYPNDCHMSPGQLMSGIQRELAAAGVTFCWNHEVQDWKTEDRRIKAAVTKSGDQRQEIEADEWVLCGGSWSPETVRRLHLSLPMQAGKGYSVMLPKPKHQPSIPAIFAEARVVATPMGSTLRIAGTMEIAGMDTTVNPRRVRGILKAVPQYYPDFTAADFEGLEAWAGLRPCSPDGLPYVGRTKRYDNLCVATGHAMMGLSLGPITGKLIAQAIAGQRSEISTELLNPDRYA
jgi:D-amino-acid dehydrogenase